MAVATPPRPARHIHPARTLALPLGLLSLLFLAYVLPPYLGLDPAAARLPLPDGVAWYYPVLVTHIGFGSIALLAAVLQVWPWLRRAHPRIHRWSGRVYLFLGVLPAGLLALVVAPFGVSGGPVAHVGAVLLALLWIGTSVAGYRAARRRRFTEHREWMVRSVALAFSIVVNRLWVIVCILAFAPSVFGEGDVDIAELNQAAGLATWLSWVVNLLLAEYWLHRTRRPAQRGGVAGPITVRGASSTA